MISPNDDLKIGDQIAEWNDAPAPSNVMEKTNGKDYERKSGTILDEDVQEAR